MDARCVTSSSVLPFMCCANLAARYQQGVQPLGEAIRQGLASGAAAGVAIDLLQMFTLLGDPGMLMK